MVPVPVLIAMLSQRADEGDEDAAIQVNAMAATYSLDQLRQARVMATTAPLETVGASPAPEPPPIVIAPRPQPAGEQTLGDILAEVFAAAAGPQPPRGPLARCRDYLADLYWRIRFRLPVL